MGDSGKTYRSSDGDYTEAQVEAAYAAVVRGGGRARVDDAVCAVFGDPPGRLSDRRVGGALQKLRRAGRIIFRGHEHGWVVGPNTQEVEVGLFKNRKETREGKYPVVLRRDGTVPEREWFVMLDGDLAAVAALRAYADAAKALGWDPEYVADVYELAESWLRKQNRERLDRVDHAARHRLGVGITEPPPESDPPAPRHRVDDPEVLSFPASLDEYRRGIRRRRGGSGA